jgi:hypothetical protein
MPVPDPRRFGVILRQVTESIPEADRGGWPALVSLIPEPDSRRIGHDERDAAKASGGNAHSHTKGSGHDRTRRKAGLYSPP